MFFGECANLQVVCVCKGAKIVKKKTTSEIALFEKIMQLFVFVLWYSDQQTREAKRKTNLKPAKKKGCSCRGVGKKVDLAKNVYEKLENFW